MPEEKIIKKQLLKNMIMNFIVFSVMFSILGIILYTVVSSSLYESSDRELTNSKNRVAIINDFNSKRDLNNQGLESRPENIDREFKRDNFNINPRIIYIVRNSNNEIVSMNPNNDMFSNITSNAESNVIYQIKINNEYNYRAINYEITANNETYKVQAFVNVDAEESIIQNFKIILIIAMIVCIFISLFASYALAKSTLKPIIESWKKQTEFVQNASHELRTPLTIIQAKQEMLLEKPNEKIIDNAEEIGITLNETKRLSKLVKELMELARGDSNKIKMDKQKTDIDKLIRETSNDFNEIAKLQNKELKVDLNYGKELYIDPNKIKELIVIILDNSLKYTNENDVITITTKNNDGRFVLNISDTGIGISDEAIKHVFERFYREDKAHSRETGGSGLGLSIANAIVNAHNGIITAKHNNPKGTIIEVKLK